MMQVSNIFALTPEWLHDFAKQLGADLIDEKFLILPDDIGEGGFFFTQVASGLSVFVGDMLLKKPLVFKRLGSDNGLYNLHYDFSDEMNIVNFEGIQQEIGYASNLGLGVFDNTTEHFFRPLVGKRFFALRLLVKEELLDKSLAEKNLSDMDKRKSKGKKKSLMFYDHIDSESRLIIQEIKNKSFGDPAFQIYVQGVSLRLLARFVDRYSNLKPMLYHVTVKEAETINLSKDYLISNLFTVFPGVDFLAEQSGMSISKYKSLFKKMFVDTPSNFFIREKMILANVLLKSGYYESLAEIVKELNYSNLTAFSRPYYNYFKRKPLEDFIKS